MNLCFSIIALFIQTAVADATAIENSKNALNISRESTPNGTFEGTGRACSGKLIITKKNVTWMTPFSQCNKAKYQIIKQVHSENELSFALKLETVSPKCLYSLIQITRISSLNKFIGWDVVGFQSAKAFDEKTKDSLSCYLIRLK
jgi:hypothetical protein